MFRKGLIVLLICGIEVFVGSYCLKGAVVKAAEASLSEEVQSAIAKLSAAKVETQIEGSIFLRTTVAEIRPAIPRIVQAIANVGPEVRMELYLTLAALGRIDFEWLTPVFSVITADLQGNNQPLQLALVRMVREVKGLKEEQMKLLKEMLQSHDSQLQTAVAVTLSRIDSTFPAYLDLQLLLKALTGEDDEERVYASQALVAFTKIKPDTSSLLLKHLETKSVKVVCAAALALGEIGSPQAIGPLAIKLRDSDEKVRNYAAYALGKIGVAAFPELVKALREPKAEVRRVALAGLGQLGPAAEPAIPIMIGLLADEACHIWAADALGKVGVVALPLLVKGFQDKSLRVGSRVALGEVIGTIGADSPGIKQILVAALSEPDPAIKSCVLEQIGKTTPMDDKTVNLFLESLRDPEQTVRETSFKILGELGPKAAKAIPYLKEYLISGDTPTFTNGVALLAKIGPEALPALTFAMTSKDPECRAATIRVVSELGEEGVPLLIMALSDTEPKNRNIALNNLRSLGATARQATHFVVNLLQTEPAMQKEAVLALWRINQPVMLNLIIQSREAKYLEILVSGQDFTAFGIKDLEEALVDPQLTSDQKFVILDMVKASKDKRFAILSDFFLNQKLDKVIRKYAAGILIELVSENQAHDSITLGETQESELRKQCANPDPGFRQPAVWLLGFSESKETLPILTNALVDPEAGVRKFAARAIDEFFNKSGKETNAVSQDAPEQTPHQNAKISPLSPEEIVAQLKQDKSNLGKILEALGVNSGQSAIEDGEGVEEISEDSKSDGEGVEEISEDSKSDGEGVEEISEDSKSDGEGVEEISEDSESDGEDVEEMSEDSESDGEGVEKMSEDSESDGEGVEEISEDSELSDPVERTEEESAEGMAQADLEEVESEAEFVSLQNHASQDGTLNVACVKIKDGFEYQVLVFLGKAHQWYFIGELEYEWVKYHFKMQFFDLNPKDFLIGVDYSTSAGSGMGHESSSLYKIVDNSLLQVFEIESDSCSSPLGWVSTSAQIKNSGIKEGNCYLEVEYAQGEGAGNWGIADAGAAAKWNVTYVWDPKTNEFKEKQNSNKPKYLGERIDYIAADFDGLLAYALLGERANVDWLKSFIAEYPDSALKRVIETYIK